MSEALSGLEALRRSAISGGRAAAMGETMNARLVSAEEGVVTMAGEPTKDHLNPLGTVHGGWALTLIDSVTALAAYTTLPPGVGYTTLETKANFVRPIKADGGRVTAVGRVVARGRTIITAEAHVTDAAGKIVAHGTSTVLVVRKDG